MNKPHWPRLLKTPLALLGMGAVGFALGNLSGEPAQLSAQQPAGPVVPASGTSNLSDYRDRVVAYIHGNTPITREELGEFLIARHGYSKIELLVNRRIIEQACAAQNITVTDAEVEASLEEDLKPMNIDRATFVKHFLKQYNKTLFEWKEDVIRPRLMLTKLVQADIKVEEADIQRLFEARFGEKVRCRIIIWRTEEKRHALQAYDKIRRSEADFATAARAQYIPALAASGGRIDPIGRGSAEHKLIEEIAFRLQDGEVSELFDIPGQGVAVLKRDELVPPVAGASLEKERENLRKIVFETKVTKAIPEYFKKLREQAKPNIIIPHGTNNPYVIKTTEEEKKLMQQEDKPIVPLPQQPAQPQQNPMK